MKAATPQSIRLLLGAILLLLAATSMAQDAQLRIGYVDMKRLLDQAPQVQQAHDRLQAEFAGRGAALQQQQDKLDALRTALEQDRPALDANASAERQRQIDLLAGSVRRAQDRLQTELKERSAEELDRSWQTVSNAAVEYARKHGYDLLLPSPVIYASPKADITGEILDKLRRDDSASGTVQ